MQTMDGTDTNADSFLFFVSAMTGAATSSSLLGLPTMQQQQQQQQQQLSDSDVVAQQQLHQDAAFLHSLQMKRLEGQQPGYQYPISPISTPATPSPVLPSLVPLAHTNTATTLRGSSSPSSDSAHATKGLTWNSYGKKTGTKGTAHTTAAEKKAASKARASMASSASAVMATAAVPRGVVVPAVTPSRRRSAVEPKQAASLSALMVRAIESSPYRHCTPTQIYEWIRASNPDMKNCTTSSISVQLSHNKAFQRVTDCNIPGNEPLYTLRKARSPRGSPAKPPPIVVPGGSGNSSLNSSFNGSVTCLNGNNPFATPVSMRSLAAHMQNIAASSTSPLTPCSALSAQLSVQSLGYTPNTASPTQQHTSVDGTPSFYIPLASPMSASPDDRPKRLKLSPSPSALSTPRGMASLRMSPTMDGGSQSAGASSDDDALPSDFSFLTTAFIPPLLSLAL